MQRASDLAVILSLPMRPVRDPAEEHIVHRAAETLNNAASLATVQIVLFLALLSVA